MTVSPGDPVLLVVGTDGVTRVRPNLDAGGLGKDE